MEIEKELHLEMFSELSGIFQKDTTEDSGISSDIDEAEDDWNAAELDGADLIVYEDVIREAVEESKWVYRKKSEPFDLMNYYEEAESSVKEKVKRFDFTVKKMGGILYACGDLTLSEHLTSKEIAEVQTFLREFYEGPWGDSFWWHALEVDGGEVGVRFWLEEEASFLVRETMVLPPRKYEITELAHPQYPFLHRIRAVEDVNEEVPKGTLGGFVENEKNLSQEGECWIYDQAISCGEASVEEKAKLMQEAVAKDFAVLAGTAVVCGQAVADMDCRIMAGEIRDQAHISWGAYIDAERETKCAPVIVGKSLVFGKVVGNFYIDVFMTPSHMLLNDTKEQIVLTDGKRDNYVDKKQETKKNVKKKNQPQR